MINFPFIQLHLTSTHQSTECSSYLSYSSRSIYRNSTLYHWNPLFLPISPIFLILLPYLLINFSPSCNLPPDFYQCLHILSYYSLSRALLLSCPCLSYIFSLVSFYPLQRGLLIIQKTKLAMPSPRSAWKASSGALDCLSQKAAGPAVCSGTCAPRFGLRGALSSHPPELSPPVHGVQALLLPFWPDSYLYLEVVSS